MKTQWIATVVLAALAGAGQTFAQSTAFAYHGRLNNNGTPVTGLYDLQFTIFDSSGGAGVIAGPLPMNGLDVTNGLFTTRLDFGAGVFTGPARWLEISVRPSGGGNFETLSPRQELTSSPYAIRAQSAGTAADVSNGSVVKSLNTLKDNVGLVAGANVTIAPSGGNTLTISSTGPGGNIWSLNGANTYYNAGNVGIGTTIPANKLTVLTPTLGYGIEHTDGDARLSTFIGRGSGWLGTLSNHKLTLFANDNGFQNMTATLDTAGRFGIGTDSPIMKLHVYEPANSVSHLIETGGGINAWAKVAFKNLNGMWEIGTSRGYNNDVFYVDRAGTAPLELQLAANGGLGLGIEPQAKLHLYEPANSVSHRIETGAGVNAWTRVEFANGNGRWNVGTSRGYNGDQLYFHREGSANIAFGVQPNGDAFLQGTLTCKVLTITGADLAEKFPSSDPQPEPGTVMEIDPDRPGQLRIAREAYCTRVAGVVSGARDLIAGAVLGNLPESKDSPPIALSGRVWLHADATGTPIKPGDLLTTSDTPGHAMKVIDHAKAQGAILGKAMSALKEGKGMVLVLVTLQ